MSDDSEGLKEYEASANKKRLVLIIMTAAIFIAAAVSISIGSTRIPLGDVFSGLLKRSDEITNFIIWEHRMPRVISAIVIGAGLSVAGCVMQNNLKNPLASPSTLGISGAAVFGANFAIIILGAGVATNLTQAVAINNPYAVTLIAFAMAMLATVVIITLSKLKNFSPAAIILAGVALGSIFAAGTTIIQYFSNDTSLATAVFWSFGDLSRIAWREVIVVAATVTTCSIFFYAMRWNYNALANGTEVAKSLGVSVDKLIGVGLLLTSLITALAVSFVGLIGFIGLLGPQIMRRIVGDDHRFLIPGSILAGSLILLAADAVARTIIAPVILPVGAVTALLGGPMFLYLLFRGGKTKW